MQSDGNLISLGTFILLIGIGSVILSLLVRFSTAPKLKKAKASESWLPTEGTIISSKVATGQTVDANYHRGLEIWFEYAANGMKYKSNWFTVGNYLVNNARNALQKIADQYTPEQKLTVYYDPSSPENAVIMKGWQRGHYLQYYGVFVLMLVGFLAVLVGLYFNFVLKIS